MHRVRDRRRLLLAAVSAALVAALSAGLSWACTPEATLSVAPGAGAAGSQATVRGSSFVGGPVEIHWGSANGPLLTTVNGPSFSTSVSVPAAAPRNYYIVAVAREGSKVWTATAPFEVTGSTAPATGGGGQEGGSPPAPGRAESRQADRGPAVAPASRARPSATTLGDARPREARNRNQAGGQDRAVARDRSGARVFSDSVAGAQAKPGAARESQASRRSAAADLWSGFRSARSPLLDGSPAAGAPAGGVGNGTTGLVAPLLALGLAALFAGFAVAGRRVSRARAG